MLTTRLDLIIGSQMVWNYFAIGHGKGKVDGVGVLLKRVLLKEQIKPTQLKV